MWVSWLKLKLSLWFTVWSKDITYHIQMSVFHFWVKSNIFFTNFKMKIFISKSVIGNTFLGGFHFKNQSTIFHYFLRFCPETRSKFAYMENRTKWPLNCFVEYRFLHSEHMTFIQRRVNVDATSSCARCTLHRISIHHHDVAATLTRRCIDVMCPLGGYLHI